MFALCACTRASCLSLARGQVVDHRPRRCFEDALPPHLITFRARCARRLLENRDRLVENVKGGLDSAKELLPPLGGEATSQQLLRRCFPARLQHAGGSGAG
jgi:hypothetical protein